MQNIPVLLQLFFWYAIFYEAFPAPRQALHPLPGVFLCNRGLVFAVPQQHPAHVAMAWAFLAALVAAGCCTAGPAGARSAPDRLFPAVRVRAAPLSGTAGAGLGSFTGRRRP